MSERREVFQPIMLSIIISFWALDEAQMPSVIGPQWLRAIVCAVVALNFIIYIWRGRETKRSRVT